MAQYVKDVIIDSDFDLLFEGGDFAVRASDEAHIGLILNSYLGAFKEFPLVGVGLSQYIASSGQETLIKRAISVQLEADNYKVNSITIAQSATNEYAYNVDAERVQ